MTLVTASSRTRRVLKPKGGAPATGGYAGKILRINLTKRLISTLDTEQYEEYGGGHGMGSAIFWDLAGNQLPFEALDPRNVVTIMTSPFSGVLVPAAAGRCEIQGLGPQAYPVEWFTRSNFGGLELFPQHRESFE